MPSFMEKELCLKGELHKFEERYSRNGTLDKFYELNRSIFFKNHSMGYSNSRSVRSQDDIEQANADIVYVESGEKIKYSIDGTRCSEASPTRRTETKIGRVLTRVFSEDYDRAKKTILDPCGQPIQHWNKIFLAACLVSLFLDPLFFYLPTVQEQECIETDLKLKVCLTIIRTLADMFYMIHIFQRFRTAYVAPSSRVFGRGELVIDPSKIAERYIRKGFFWDFIASLPLPQVLIWFIIPKLKGSIMANTKNVLRFCIFIQYLPRLYLIFPLSSQIIKANGVVTKTAWAGAAYNLMLYMLASHVLGACWYLLSLARTEECWRSVCLIENTTCQYGFFDCYSIEYPKRISWFKTSNVTSSCKPDSNYYEFGIYDCGVISGVIYSPFLNKLLYCLWWGLKNLTSLGQNLSATSYIGEVLFALVIPTLGLVLFALLIGNMQTYIQSTTVRLEEWRVKRTDTEEWMRHRQLPQELRQSVREYDQYKWMATRGVDEEAILRGLPLDLRRNIKRHLCLDLVRRVPLFDQMEERMLDAICERLNPALSTEGTILVREGDPVTEMLFIIRGHLDSYTTNGGSSGFFNSCRIGPGDFCGEELLTWALDRRPSISLPCSSRTVKAFSEVEAFALTAEDLQFVASQSRRLHSKQLRHKFKCYSHQWRTRAACFIQAAWRRYKRRKALAALKSRENEASDEPESLWQQRGLLDYATRLADSTKRGHNKVQEPTELDFSDDDP